MIPSLAGIRVIDLTRALAGPYCTRMLFDLGAEVLKVEPPPDGDATRRITYVRPDGYSGYLMYANRGKSSLGLNLRHAEGLEVLRRLVTISDVVVENYRPGVMDRLGLGFEALRGLNPSIVLCSISGYGESSPYSAMPGQDMGGQAIAGVTDMTGEPDGSPLVPNFALADSHAGIHGTVAILAALVKRDETGEAQHIDLAISDAAFWLHDTAIQEALGGGSPGRRGTAHPTLVPRGVFPIATEWLALDASDQADWRRLTHAMGRPELADDPLFATPSARAIHREAILRLVADWLALFPSAAAASDLLSAAGVPAERVATVTEAIEHPQTKARAALAPTLDPVVGDIPVHRVPFGQLDLEGYAQGDYPLYGAADLPILASLLGYRSEAIARMYFDNAIQAEEKAAPELLALLQHLEN